MKKTWMKKTLSLLLTLIMLLGMLPAASAAETGTIDMSKAKIAASGTKTAIKVTFPAPVAIAANTSYDYSLTVYKDAAHTDSIATLTATKNVTSLIKAGSTITLTPLSKSTTVTSHFTDNKALPNGTYYLSISLTYGGVTYAGKSAVTYSDGVDTGDSTQTLDLGTLTLSRHATASKLSVSSFNYPATVATTDATYAYTFEIWADEACTANKISRLVRKAGTSATAVTKLTPTFTMLSTATADSTGITGFDPTDNTTLPGGTYYMNGTLTIAGQEYIVSAKLELESLPQTEPIDLSAATLSLNTDYLSRMNINYPIPVALAKSAPYTYAATLYINDDYSGKIGRVTSKSSTAPANYAQGDIMTHTMLSSNKDAGITVEGYDGTNYTTLPSGTYYVEVELGIDDVSYKGQSAVEWTKPEIATVTFLSGTETFATKYITIGTPAITPLKTPVAEEGYEFKGWYNGETAYDFETPVTEDFTLTAKFEPIPVEIKTQPVSAAAKVGEQASFSIAAEGYGDLTYQWQVSPNGETWTDCTSATAQTAAYTTDPIPAEDDGVSMYGATLYVRCIVTSINDASVTSDVVTLTIEEAEEPEIEKFDFYATQMVLGNALDMQFAFPQGTLGEGNYVEFVKTSGKDGSTASQIVPYEEWTVNGGYYVATYTGLAAKEMADEIAATVYDAEGNVLTNPCSTSVRAYAMKSIGNVSEDQIPLFVDMLNYGAAAQVRFDYDTDNLANAQLTAEHQAYATTAAGCENQMQKGAKAYATQLVLENSILMQIAFTDIEEGMYAKVSFKDHYNHDIEERVEFEANGGYSVLTIDQVVLADARTLFTVNVYDANGEVVDTHIDSMESMIARNAMAENTDVFQAIMNFADGAYAFFRSKA